MYKCEGTSRDCSTRTEYQTARPLTIDILPVEIWHKIFSYLDEQSLKSTARTCWTFKSTAELFLSNLWKERCAKDNLSTDILSKQSSFIYETTLKTHLILQKELTAINNRALIHPNASGALLDFEIGDSEKTAMESREKLFNKIVSEIQKNQNLFLVIYAMGVLASNNFEKKAVKSYVEEFDRILETMTHKDTLDADFLIDLKIVCERWQGHLAVLKNGYSEWIFGSSPSYTMVAEDLFRNELNRNEERIKKISNLIDYTHHKK